MILKNNTLIFNLNNSTSNSNQFLQTEINQEKYSLHQNQTSIQILLQLILEFPNHLYPQKPVIEIWITLMIMLFQLTMQIYKELSKKVYYQNPSQIPMH